LFGIVTVPGFFFEIVTTPLICFGIITTPLILLGIITVLILDLITVLILDLRTVLDFRDYSGDPYYFLSGCSIQTHLAHNYTTT
jgi:hypothetical protein